MTTWILIWIVSSSGGYTPAATGSAVFHSKESCLAAAKTSKLTSAWCFEDAMPKETK